MQNLKLHESDGWFYASYMPDWSTDNLGRGGEATMRFQSEEARTYYLRAEEFREQISRLVNELEPLRERVAKFDAEMQRPFWKELLAKPDWSDADE